MPSFLTCFSKYLDNLLQYPLLLFWISGSFDKQLTFFFSFYSYGQSFTVFFDLISSPLLFLETHHHYWMEKQQGLFKLCCAPILESSYQTYIDGFPSFIFASAELKTIKPTVFQNRDAALSQIRLFSTSLIFGRW